VKVAQGQKKAAQGAWAVRTRPENGSTRARDGSTVAAIVRTGSVIVRTRAVEEHRSRGRRQKSWKAAREPGKAAQKLVNAARLRGLNGTGVDDGETVGYMWLEGNRHSGVTVPWNVRGRWGGGGRS
jgi:hypothetical protein